MTHITGIGGIFFKSKDPEALKNWYRDVLGLATDQWGWSFKFDDDKEPSPFLQWSPFKQDTDYFEPSAREFMVNFRVNDLDGLLKSLKEKGVEPVGAIQDDDYGRFAWIMDPEGTKLELWQPKDPPGTEET